MKIKNVVQMFAVFDGSLEEFNPLRGLPQAPYLLVRFRARPGYYAEDAEGKIVLRRKYQREFNKIRYQFIDKFLPVFNDTKTTDLVLANQLVPWLTKKFAEKLSVPNELELDSIELAGLWQIFADNSTVLARESMEEMKAEIFKE